MKGDCAKWQVGPTDYVAVLPRRLAVSSNADVIARHQRRGRVGVTGILPQQATLGPWHPRCEKPTETFSERQPYMASKTRVQVCKVVLCTAAVKLIFTANATYLGCRSTCGVVE